MTTGEGMPGPVCMFGSEADPDARSRSAMETAIGFRVRDGSVMLSSYLGGTVMTVSDLEGVPDVPDGEYRALFVGEDVASLMKEAGVDPDGKPAEVSTAISAEPVTREVATRICRSINRRDGLCVYTPRRDDAMDLASRLFVGGKPVEAKVPKSMEGHVAGVVGIKGKDTVRIAYGRR